MNILWIADYKTEQHKGGAQQTNETMIRALEKRHKVDYVSSNEKEPSLDYDLIILNNITKFRESFIEELLATKKCVRYEHDYWVAENRKSDYKKCLHNIFLSPLHKKEVERLVGYKIENSSIIPSPVDSRLFRPNEKKEKENTVIYTGNVCELKGKENLVKYAKDNPSLRIMVIGWGDVANMPSNIEFIKEVTQKELVKYYQKSKYFFHRPIWKEPFGRSVIEAYLCGCSLLLNDNVGALSYGWDFSKYDLIKRKVKSENNFIKVLEDVYTRNNMDRNNT